MSTNQTTIEKKRALRAHYKEKRAALSEKFRAEEDAAICRAIVECEAYKSAATVLLYYPVGDEINVLDVFFDALRCGKTVAFPRCETRDGAKYMTFRCVKALDELEKGVYNIPCPSVFAEEAQSESTVCIVPALAYDAQGYRIGYGGGYYDRFLQSYQGESVGVYRTGFLHGEALPRESTDEKCRHLANKEGVRKAESEQA